MPFAQSLARLSANNSTCRLQTHQSVAEHQPPPKTWLGQATGDLLPSQCEESQFTGPIIHEATMRAAK
jgi:hypothetical protein